jgi:short-subunit dehydrogenase
MKIRPRDDIGGEVALVTGASRGLGLLLARELASHSCPLVICARDAAELERAADQLRAAGAQVQAVVCDLTDEASPQLLVDTAVRSYGRLDILINNAGVITVGPVQAMRAADFETALATMALAPARLALAALPVMRGQSHGRIVTISSIGGKIAAPHLLPYDMAKFAATGFSEGLRGELGRGPVTATTVVPGLMRTGSHVQALFTGQESKEFTWFSLGASLPFISMDAERAAHQIVEGVRERRAEIILTPAAQVVARVAGIAPGLTSGLLHLTQRLALPAPQDRAHGSPVPGHALSPAFSQKAFDRLTALGRAAARRHNEQPASAEAARAVGGPADPRAQRGEIDEDQLLRSQVALKFWPPLSEETLSFGWPELLTMMIWVTPPALPSAPPLAVEPLMFTVPKFASGRMPPPEVQHGASTMTSAEERGAPDRVPVVVWLQPCVVSWMNRLKWLLPV